jgi:hypothetical protein
LLAFFSRNSMASNLTGYTGKRDFLVQAALVAQCALCGGSFLVYRNF